MKEVISITNLEQETDTFVNHPNLKMFNQKKKKKKTNKTPSTVIKILA